MLQAQLVVITVDHYYCIIFIVTTIPIVTLVTTILVVNAVTTVAL